MILCIGEVLWDVFPTQRFLGGAPFNVACHLKALGQDVSFASRIGQDALGDEILSAVSTKGIPTTLLQRDPTLPTGVVNVTFPAPDHPQYDIHYPAAWDAIEYTPDLHAAVGKCTALVFGTLAQRDAMISGDTIRRALDDCPGTLVCDLNLRPPYDTEASIAASLERTDWLKLNDAELDRLRKQFALPEGDPAAAKALARQFDLDVICLTRGHRGAALLINHQWLEHPGYEVTVADTVGAGDSFLASLLCDLLAHRDPATALAKANAVAAYVASQPSATPALDPDAMARIQATWKPDA